MSSEAKLLFFLYSAKEPPCSRAGGSPGPLAAVQPSAPGGGFGRRLPKRAFTGERATRRGFPAPSAGRAGSAGRSRRPGAVPDTAPGARLGPCRQGPFRAEPVRLPRLPPGAGEDRQQPAANAAGSCPLSVRDRAVPGGGASGPGERAARRGCAPHRPRCPASPPALLPPLSLEGGGCRRHSAVAVPGGAGSVRGGGCLCVSRSPRRVPALRRPGLPRAQPRGGAAGCGRCGVRQSRES